ncbi:MAG: hypothetical protein M3355_02655 [Actinomycetota bacterium]|nr:hypothetical protein [Actinomycetota bacterium]
MTEDEIQNEQTEDPPNQGETTEGAKQGDNPGVDEIEGEGGEGDDQGGLGDRTGGSGGAVADKTEEGTTDSAEHSK